MQQMPTNKSLTMKLLSPRPSSPSSNQSYRQTRDWHSSGGQWRFGHWPGLFHVCITSIFQSLIYFVIMCAILLETTISSPVLSPPVSLPLHKNRQPSQSLNTWPTSYRATYPQPQASNSPAMFSSYSNSYAASNTKIYGPIDCMVAIHADVSRCKANFQNSLTELIKKGLKKESKLYRKESCCGHWTQKRCISDYIQRRCDRQTFLQMTDDKNSMMNSKIVVVGDNSMNCVGFEKHSAICSGAMPLGNLLPHRTTTGCRWCWCQNYILLCSLIFFSLFQLYIM